jgi:hypothetical protein
LLDIETKGPLLIHFAACDEQIHRKSQRIFEQKETKLTKVRDLPSGKLFFRKRSSKSQKEKGRSSEPFLALVPVPVDRRLGP